MLNQKVAKCNTPLSLSLMKFVRETRNSFFGGLIRVIPLNPYKFVLGISIHAQWSIPFKLLLLSCSILFTFCWCCSTSSEKEVQAEFSKSGWFINWTSVKVQTLTSVIRCPQRKFVFESFQNKICVCYLNYCFNLGKVIIIKFRRLPVFCFYWCHFISELLVNQIILDSLNFL